MCPLLVTGAWSLTCPYKCSELLCTLHLTGTTPLLANAALHACCILTPIPQPLCSSTLVLRCDVLC